MGLLFDYIIECNHKRAIVNIIMRIIFCKSVCLIFFMLLLQACSSADAPETLKIGYIQEPPFSKISNQGTPAGLFPDVARKVAKSLGIKQIEWVLLSFDDLIPSILDGRVDVVAAGMTINQSRQKKVCFANPIVYSDTALLTLEANDEYSPDSPLFEQALRFLVINGSVEAELAKEHLLKRNIMQLEDAHLAVKALKKGHADVLMMTRPTLRHLHSQDPKGLDVISLESEVLEPQAAAFAFHSFDSAFVNRWNKAQEEIVKSTYFSQKAKRLGFEMKPLEATSSSC